MGVGRDGETSCLESVREMKSQRMLLMLLVVILLITVLAVVIIAVLASKVGSTTSTQSTIEVDKRQFGTTDDGEQIEAYTMRNQRGMEVEILTLGGIIRTLKVPDRQGNLDDCVLGFTEVSGYLDEHPYFGTLIGRYGNRIANGQFTIDGVTYHVTKNTYGDPPQNHLHGGTIGWDKRVWAAAVVDGQLVLSLESPDTDQGYPGTVMSYVTFQLTEDNQLIMRMNATSDKATPINLTTHSYFNLAKHDDGLVYDHQLTVYADQYLVIDAAIIPTGEVQDVGGTLLDLRQSTRLGDKIDDTASPALTDDTGVPLFDHNFCIRGPTGKKAMARLHDPGSGRVLMVYSNQPGLQVYTGRFLNISSSTWPTKDGAPYLKHSGIALEPQNYPDAPNHASFPDSILRPGSVYEHTVWYEFSTDEN